MSPAREAESRSRGFSLVEAVLSLAVASILLVGMGAALTMTVSAADRGNDVNTRAMSAMEAADRITADVNEAQAVTERTNRSITVRVSDRDGDGTDDEVRYAFDATKGWLTRELNGGTAEVILRGVGDAQFRTMIRSLVGASESAERLLASCDGLLTLSTFKVDGNNACGQVVMPVFDSSVIAWSVTRTRLWLSPDSAATAKIRVRLLKTPRFGSGTTLLAETVINESSLPLLGGWVDPGFAKAAGLLPSDAVLISVAEEGNVTGGAARVAYFGSGSLPYNTYMTTSGDTGATWSGPVDTDDLRFELYGTVTTQGGR